MSARLIAALLAFTPGGAFAAGYERPMPQPQSATAELWFLLASLAMIGALYLVHRLVNRQ
ncbi:hypothetical protein [Aliiroseovarius sp. YM-037]|uniref:hypothetical protein n=1 Tax=Aliiroseovarius sp. YM-037 TaxID=3341728 RepID=UPI003A80D403